MYFPSLFPFFPAPHGGGSVLPKHIFPQTFFRDSSTPPSSKRREELDTGGRVKTKTTKLTRIQTVRRRSQLTTRSKHHLVRAWVTFGRHAVFHRRTPRRALGCHRRRSLHRQVGAAYLVSLTFFSPLLTSPHFWRTTTEGSSETEKCGLLARHTKHKSTQPPTGHTLPPPPFLAREKASSLETLRFGLHHPSSRPQTRVAFIP